MSPRQWFLVAIVATLFSLFLGFTGVETTLRVAQHTSFVAWTVFIFWYGLRIRWEDTVHGVNTMIVSAGLWLILLLVQISIFWPGQIWLPWLRIPIYLFITIGGLQRDWFMIRRRDGDRDAVSTLHPPREG